MASPPPQTHTVEDALWTVLADAIASAAASDSDFAVVGGWSPVLLNSSPVRHPGTRDVDLLFQQGADEAVLHSVCESLLANGFVPSAKHPFQLLRVLNVGGRELAFNVDLLHPTMSKDPSKLFVDQLDLGVVLSSATAATLRMKSVVTPVSAFIFDGHVVQVTRVLPSDPSRSVTVPVIDELGLLVTKSQSVKSVKRDRDALDICFAVAQARDRDRLAQSMVQLKHSSPVAFECLLDLKAQVNKRDSQFNKSLELQFSPQRAGWLDTVRCFFNVLA